MFNIKSKVLKNFRWCNNKYSICIYRHKELDLLPRITLERIPGDSLISKNLIFSWLFWEISFSKYTRIVKERKTTEIPDGSLVNDFLHQQIEPIMAAKKEAEEKEKLEEKLPDGVDYTKIKLEMVRANDLFKDKWKEVSSALNSPSPVFGCPNNYINYTISAGDLADINLKIKGSSSCSRSLNPLVIQEEHDYFNRHFKSMAISQTDLEDWGKLEKEWLEGGNKITPIPKEEGRIITKEDVIHTIAFVQPLGLDSYIKSALCDQKEKGRYCLSGDIDTILTGAYKQVNISESKTKRENIVKKSWKKFNEKYGGSSVINDCYLSLKLFCDSTLFDNSERIKKFFIDNYSDNWDKVRESITKNYYFNCYDFSKGGRADIGVISNISVFKKILKDIFDIDAESAENEYVKEYIQKYTYNIKFTLNDLDRPTAVNDWSLELYNLILSAKSDPRGSCECVLANRLVKYAYAPSRNWGIDSFYDKVHEARLEFDKELLDTLYSKKWQEVYDSIQTTGKYEVTVEDLKQYTKDYYTYISNKVKDLSNTYIFTPSLKEILNRVDTAFAISTDEYKKFEITQEKYTSWKEDNFFTCCGGIISVYPIEWTEWKHRDDLFSYDLLNKDKSIKEDILAHSYIFVPPACMTDFYEKDKDQCSIEEKAMEAVRIIQEAADEAIKSLKSDK